MALPLFGFTQKLNKAGHIILPTKQIEYSVHMQNNTFEINFQNKSFKGNTLFEISNGYLTVDGNYENGVSQLYIYNTKGAELFHKKYNQTINIALSENKSFAAFYNSGNVHVLNLSSKEEQVYKASPLFVVHNNGSISFVNTADNTMHTAGVSSTASTLITKVIQQNNIPYFIGKHKIYSIVNNEIKEIYQSTKSIFDVEILRDTFYISEKETETSAYLFKLKSTKDFNEFVEKETISYPRIISEQKKSIDQKSNKTSILDNETISNPLDFVSDSSYQAIGNSYNEIQEYSPGDTYLHPGVDLFGDYLQNVHSVKSGYVKAVLTTSGAYHWRVAIANQNTTDSSQGYLYAHLEENLIPVTVGDTVAEGEVIGQLVDFPVTGFVHCHFARIVDAGLQWSGSWWTFDNPLVYMENFRDTTAPVFEEVIVGSKFGFRNILNKEYISSSSVTGKVDIVSKVYDQMNTFWKVDVHKTGYSILKKGTTDSVVYSTNAFNFNMFNDTYFSGPYIQDIINTMYARDASCMSTGNYNERTFYHILSNSDGDDSITGIDSTLYFDSEMYPNGEYKLKVWAEDAAGNRTVDSMDFFIDNFVGINSNKNSAFSIYPNPAKEMVYIKNNSGKPSKLKLYNFAGIELQEIEMKEMNTIINLQGYPAGMYFLKLNSDKQHSEVKKLLVR